MLRSGDIERLKRVAALLKEGYALKAVPARIRESIQMELPLRQAGADQRRLLLKVRDGLEGILSALGGGAGK